MHGRLERNSSLRKNSKKVCEMINIGARHVLLRQRLKTLTNLHHQYQVRLNQRCVLFSSGKWTHCRRDTVAEGVTSRTKDGVKQSSLKSKTTAFAVDRSTLPGGGWYDDDEVEVNAMDHAGDGSSNTGRVKDSCVQLANKETLTPLAKDLQYYIKMRGPISLHDYVAQTANHSIYGYYQQTPQVIGEGGDFITSPEISQLFGEIIAVWFISVWKSLGSPQRIRLVELGPGKGTLMKDILRVAKRFPAFMAALSVHMVEMSESMRQLQKDALGCADGEGRTDDREGTCTLQPSGGMPAITWYKMFSQVPAPTSEPLLLVAQEFLDALPVHQFVYTEKGWREKLVDIDESTSEADRYNFRSVLARSATPAAKAFFGGEGAGVAAAARRKVERDIDALRSDIGVGKTGQRSVTGSSSGALPAKKLQSDDKDAGALAVGDEIEICPLALATTEDVAKQLVACGGAGLLIDYGEMFTQGDSLRGFKRHQQVSIYSEPGFVDVTADVDFAMCAKHASMKGAKVFGAISQGDFLMRMGIVERLERLIELPTTTDEQATSMVSAFRRLVGEAENGMGKRFKVMAISDNKTEVEGFDLEPVLSKNT